MPEAQSDADPFVRQWCAKALASSAQEQQSIQRHLAKVLLQIDRLQVNTLHAWAAASLEQFGPLIGLPNPLQWRQTSSNAVDQAWRRWWTRLVESVSPDELLGLSLLGVKPQGLATRVAARLAQPLSPLSPDPIVHWRMQLGRWRTGAATDVALEALMRANEVIEASIGAKSRIKLNGNKVRAGTVAEVASTVERVWRLHTPAKGAIEKLHEVGHRFRLVRLAKDEHQLEQLQAEPFWQVLDAMSAWIEQSQGLLAGLIEEAATALRADLNQQQLMSAVLDFDDQMAWMHEACCRHPLRERFVTAVAQSVRGVLIDECQDTDPRQWSILGALFGGRSCCPVVLVGDPKQAVYRFRGADVHAYVAVRDGGLVDSRGEVRACEVHRLAENQRSHEGVIRDVNHLLMPAALWIEPGLSYAGAQRGAKPLPAFTDISGVGDGVVGWLAPQSKTAQANPRQPGADEAVIVASLVREIQRLLDPAQVSFDGRAVRPDDIAVLVNSHDQAGRIREQLVAQGLPVRLDREALSLFALPEAQELRVVLRALATPADPRALASAALVLGTCPSSIEFNQSLQRLALRGPQAILDLPMWLDAAPRLSWQGMVDPMTKQVWRELLEALIHACAGSSTLEQALDWLDERCLRSGEAMHDRWLDQTQHSIAVLTTFAAKGLEFAFVFIPYAWKSGAQHQVARLRLGIDHQDGQPSVLDIARFHDENTDRALAQAEMADAVRRLYVGLTRAIVRATLVLFSGHVLKHLETVHGPLAVDGPWPIAIQPLPEVPVEPLTTPGVWRRQSATPSSRSARAVALVQPLVSAPKPSVLSTSFTALTRTLSLNTEARIARVLDESLRQDPADLTEPTDPRELLPEVRREGARGLSFGIALHSMLERWNFRQAFPVAWAQQWPGAQHDVVDATQIVEWMNSLVNLPLDPITGMGLAQWHEKSILREWEFTLRLKHSQWDAVNELLHRYAWALSGPKTDGPANGVLRGAADLVLMDPQGRFHLLDWKSNFLGPRLIDYGPARLDQAMLDGQYHLQWLLYGVALHRWLTRRLPAYEPAQHLGSVHYVFLRGAGLHDERGQALGHWGRPLPVEMIIAVNRILDSDA
jgi:exodeoxyribonuclease V beta subunit